MKRMWNEKLIPNQDREKWVRHSNNNNNNKEICDLWRKMRAKQREKGQGMSMKYERQRLWNSWKECNYVENELEQEYNQVVKWLKLKEINPNFKLNVVSCTCHMACHGFGA